MPRDRSPDSHCLPLSDLSLRFQLLVHSVSTAPSALVRARRGRPNATPVALSSRSCCLVCTCHVPPCAVIAPRPLASIAHPARAVPCSAAQDRPSCRPRSRTCSSIRARAGGGRAVVASGSSAGAVVVPRAESSLPRRRTDGHVDASACDDSTRGTDNLKKGMMESEALLPFAGSLRLPFHVVRSDGRRRDGGSAARLDTNS